MNYSFLLKCCLVLVLVLVSQTVAQEANATESGSNNLNTTQYNTILDNIGQIPNASMVNNLLSKEYLKDVREMLNQSATCSSNGHPLTFFVPTDAAITKTLDEHKNLTGGASDLSGLESTEEGKNYIRALFHLHMVNGAYTLQQAANASVVPTYLDYKPYANLGNLSQVLQFSKSPQRLPTIETERNFSSLKEHNFQFAEAGSRNESNISIVSIYHTKNGLQLANVSGSAVNSSNGILYLIDSVIPIPPNATEQMYNANLTTFRSLLKATGLSKKVNNYPKTTILAPSNAALEAFRKKLEGIANSSMNGNGGNTKNYFLEGLSLYPLGLQTQARRPNHRQTPITKMSSEIDELQVFTLSGPTFQLYSPESDSDSDEVVSECDNSTLSQFTRFGLTNEDMITFLQSHIIDGRVLYASNITNSTIVVTMNGYLATLSETKENGSFVVTIDSNVTNDRNHDSSFIEPLGAPEDNVNDGNASSIYTNVLTQNGVMHILNKVVTAPAFIANVSENISKAAAANYNAQQYCDSTLKGSSNKQHQTFDNGLHLDAQSEPQCGQNELICWVQPKLNQMCQTAYKEGPKAFMDQLIKSRPVGTCYSGDTHVCVNSTTLCPHEAPEQCSGICFNSANYSCSNHFFLCNNKSPLRCGDACYSSEYYECKDNSILVSKQNTTAARNP